MHRQVRTAYQPIEEIDIDLDVHPRNRWDQPLLKFWEKSRIDMKRILKRIPEYMHTIFKIISEILKSNLEDPEYNGKFTKYNEESYYEYEGMAKILKLQTYEVMLVNFMYEVTLLCFAVVAQNDQGEVLLARNLDFPTTLRGVAFQGNFYKGGKLLYKAMMLAGYTGTFTIMKPGKFAIALNSKAVQSPFRGVIMTFLRMTGVYNPTALMVKTCEQAESFEEAVEILSSTPLTVPTYYLVSGTEKNQGLVITRDTTKPVDIWRIDPESPKEWALVQTNDDHWDPQLSELDHNKTAASYDALKTLTSANLNEKTIFSEVLHKEPMLTAWAIYSIVTNVRTGYFQAVKYL